MRERERGEKGGKKMKGRSERKMGGGKGVSRGRNRCREKE